MRYKPSEKIKRLILEYWKSPRMYDYCVSKLSNELELENGLILKFEKPSIETHFCYGYSLSNIDSESYDTANKNVENARKDVVNFINENIAQSGLQALYNKLKKPIQFIIQTAIIMVLFPLVHCLIKMTNVGLDMITGKIRNIIKDT